MRLFKTLFGVNGAGSADRAYRENVLETEKTRDLVRQLKQIEEEAGRRRPENFSLAEIPRVN